MEVTPTVVIVPRDHPGRMGEPDAMRADRSGERVGSMPMVRAAAPRDRGAARRPLRSRDARWARVAARGLSRRAIPPNLISLASLAFAGLAAAALLLVPHAPVGARIALLVGAAVAIQFRLLANLLDGMVAVEGGLGTPSGAFFNEFPDRVSDVVVLVAVGYATGSPGWPVALAWLAAVLAVMTAYVRVLGVALGATERFSGPMAKPHRMAVLTLACLAAAAEAATGWPPRALTGVLGLIAAGSAATIARRAHAIVRELESPAPTGQPRLHPLNQEEAP